MGRLYPWLEEREEESGDLLHFLHRFFDGGFLVDGQQDGVHELTALKRTNNVDQSAKRVGMALPLVVNLVHDGRDRNGFTVIGHGCDESVLVRKGQFQLIVDDVDGLGHGHGSVLRSATG